MTVTVNSIALLSVSITAPTNNTVFTAPATFTITAVPAGGSTPYAQVEFFVGTNSAGVATSSPFTTTAANLLLGKYVISAVDTDNNFNTASNSILVNVGRPFMTNYKLPAACADIYSSGSVDTGVYLDAGSSIHGALEFAAFNTSPNTSILLEVNPYALPLFATNVNVYGFDGGTGTLASSNYNSGTLIGVWTLPPGLNYGQAATFDVTAFVNSTKGPYFGFILTDSWIRGAIFFSSTTENYGTPPELYVVSPVPAPLLTATRAGNRIIVSWTTNNWANFTLQAAPSFNLGLHGTR